MSIPKQMLTAMREDQRFGTKKIAEIEALALAMSLASLSNVGGVGRKLVVQYALDSGRAAELYETNWPLDEDAWMIAAQAYFLADLKQDYEAPTANDRANIKQLAFFMAMREKLSRELVKVTDDPDTGTMETSRAARALTTVQTQILELEKHLEIDPAARAANAAQDGGASVISDLVETAAAYLADEGVIHGTDHGRAGITLWNFPDLQYMPFCADCGGRHFVYRSPYNMPSDPTVYDFVVATPEQVAAYTFAGDFIPSGAPALPIFESLNGAQD